VPKYNDYLGTPLEPVAKIELETSLQVTNLSIRAIKECAGKDYLITEEDARFLLVYFWSTCHGFIAGFNNTLLNYMHENPISVKEGMLSLIHDTFVREVRSRRVKSTGQRDERTAARC
jgi:hypothetical protein